MIKLKQTSLICLFFCLSILSPAMANTTVRPCCTIAPPFYGQPCLGCPEFCELPNWTGYVNHVEGKGIGYSTGYTTLGLLYTPILSTPNFQPFFDIKDHIFNDGRQAFNIGFGSRFLFTNCGGYLLGFNIYYDYWNKNKGHAYNQIGAGFELFSRYFDIRWNGYWPIGSTSQSLSKRRFSFPNHPELFAICNFRQQALTGFDVELASAGDRVCFPFALRCLPLSFYVGFGAYYYRAESCSNNLAGGRLRFITTIYDFMNVELIATLDTIYHGGFQIGVSFPFPFSFTSNWSYYKCWLRNLAVQPVWRNDIIVTDKKHCVWESNLERSRSSPFD